LLERKIFNKKRLELRNKKKALHQNDTRLNYKLKAKRVLKLLF